MSSILIIDDEKNIRRTLRLVLEGENYQVCDAKDMASAEHHLSSEESFDAILLDVKLGQDNGLDLLEKIKSHTAGSGSSYTPQIPVIIISGHASIEDAVRATKLGAFDFLEKPLNRNRVVVTVRNAVERHAMQTQVHSLQDAVHAKFQILGQSQVVENLKRQIMKVAPTKTRVLITGQSGTGKELIARALHRNSSVSQDTFVKVNCAAISPELIESELFGHERGAFTGAHALKRGLFEIANGGTIFLDEIGDMPLAAQAKVLRVLQTGDFQRVGAEQTRTTECRVIAATNKDLEQAIKDNEFREDLYFRLNVFPIHSPSLEDRLDDIPLLLQRFVSDCCHENGFSTKQIDQQVVQALQDYHWPGNVRELRNIAERLVIMSDDFILVKDLPAYLGGPSPANKDSLKDDFNIHSYSSHSLREFRDELESHFILHRLEEFKWNISRTALSLGIERTNLHKKLKALGIQRP